MKKNQKTHQYYNKWLPEWSQLVASTPSITCVPVDAACTYLNSTNVIPLAPSIGTVPLQRTSRLLFVRCLTRIFAYSLVHLKSAKQNLEGARSHPEIVENVSQPNKGSKTFLSCALPFFQISRFGVIPKNLQPGKLRLIVDLSYPKGNTVNDGIPRRLCSIKYTTLDDAIQYILSLGLGTLLAKIGIKSAFRLLPIHPGDRHLLGIKWNNEIYLDTCLPFGLQSAPSFLMS